MSELRYWLALNFLPSMGPVLARRLVALYGSPERIFSVSERELQKTGKIGPARAQQIRGFREWDIVEREISRAEAEGVKLITISDDVYPEGLKHIPASPLVLYVKGECKEADRNAIAVVGSRMATDYGRRVAERISYDIAERGVTIVSGMARGIDTASHRGALKADGRTIAVLGSGIDVPYPRENRKLMEAIALSGAVISEFPFGAEPAREHFPRRNRIISGLSLGVLVVEATVDSGSLITVGYALEQGREVFALPGNITSRNSKGTNTLIKKGAKLIESAEDVIEELPPQIRDSLKERKARRTATRTGMTEEEQVVYDCLDNEPKHVDTIIRNAGISTGRALSVLLSLELKGLVVQADGKKFALH